VHFQLYARIKGINFVERSNCGKKFDRSYIFGRSYMLKKLFKLNVSNSLLIVSILSFPLILFVINKGFLDFYSAKLFGKLAIIYFSWAFLLYLFLYLISHLPKSKLRKILVVFTRIYIRFHIALAIIGTLLIAIHVIIMAA
jgi:hypothetical protein